MVLGRAGKGVPVPLAQGLVEPCGHGERPARAGLLRKEDRRQDGRR